MSAFRVATYSAFFLCLMVLAACSSSGPSSTASNEETSTTAAAAASKEKEEAPKGPVLFTGQECFTRMQGQAQRWSPDALPFHMVSTSTPEATGKDGKASQWTAMFASASRGSVRTFTCSKDGITAGLEDNAAGPAIVFQPFLLKINSDKAFEVAQQHGGEALLKRDPKQPITYMLEMARGQSVPYWYVIYGEDMKNSKGVGVINATTGAFIRATK